MKIGDNNYWPHNGFYYKTFMWSRWLLVYHFNSKKSSFFTSETEAKSSNLDDKYSILGLINSNMKYYDKYEFLLEYPELKLRNHWRQSDNPCDIEEGSYSDGKEVEGYEPISVNMTTKYWGGLVKSSKTEVFIDGSANHQYWHYTIGPYYLNNDDSYPGPNMTSVFESVLWLRVNLNNIICTNKINCYRNKITLLTSFLLLIYLS